MKELFLRYAALKQQIAEHEDQLEQLKPEIATAIAQMNPLDKIVEVDGVGTFSLSAKRKYIYPAGVVELEDKLKQAKKEAEAKGTATYTVTEYPLFKAAVIE